MAGAMPTMIAMTVALCLGALAGGAAASRATRPPTRVPVPTVPIGGGVEMPILGLGSCCGSYNVTSWLGMGLRHIDTSCDYGSEPAVRVSDAVFPGSRSRSLQGGGAQLCQSARAAP